MPNWADPSWGNQFANGSQASDPLRNQNVYEYDPQKDNAASWSQRAWQQSTADFGRNSLNPYISQNPNANSPYARWYQSRFGTVAPTNLFSTNLISGTPMTADTVANQLKQLQQGQNGAGPNGPGWGNLSLQAEQGQLKGIGNMLGQFNRGDKSNLNTAQQGMLGQMLNDPALSSQMIMSGLQGAMGGWGMNYIGNELGNLQNQYYNDPAHMGPQAAGPFFNQALNLLGMGA